MYAMRGKIMKSVFFIPVLLLYSAIFLVTLIFTKYWFFKEQFCFISIGFYGCLLMVLINHVLTMTTEPGIVVESKCLNYSEKEKKDSVNSENKKNFFQNYCKKCKIVRPERSNHCKTCKRCVLKMNQHCPWMFNCIGLNNEKYYYLFLFYSIIALFIVIIGLTLRVYHYELSPKEECNDGVFLLNSFRKFKPMGEVINNEFFVILMQVYCNFSDVFHISFGIILSFFLIVAAICCFELQTILLLKNRTLVESLRLKKNQNSPYFYNFKLQNIKIVLGDSPIKWFLPIVENQEGYFFPKPNLDKFNEIELKNLDQAHKKDDEIKFNKQN